MTRGQAVIAGSAAIAAAALIGLLVVARDDDRRPSNVVPEAGAATDAEVAVVHAPPPLPTKQPAPSAKPTSAMVVADAGVDAFDPLADDSWKLLDAANPAAPGDVFEDPEAKVQRAKLLSRVGVIRVGYFHKDAAVNNEAAVTSVLRRAALEIDRLDRDRQDPPYKRFPEYEAVLAKYREELRPHMTGTIVVGGVGWSLGIKVQADAG